MPDTASTDRSSRPIFIVGCQRSGTTMLRLMLNGHPRISIPPESHFIPELYRPDEPPPDPEQFLADLAEKERFQEWGIASDAEGEALR